MVIVGGWGVGIVGGWAVMSGHCWGWAVMSGHCWVVGSDEWALLGGGQ